MERGRNASDDLFELRLEALEASQRLPREFILMYRSSVRPRLAIAKKSKVTAGRWTSTSRFHACSQSDGWKRRWISSSTTSIDMMVGSCRHARTNQLRSRSHC